MKHTSGPWTVHRSMGHRYDIVATDEHVAVVKLITPAKTRANAQLIAEAPTMFEYLKHVLEYAPDDLRREIENLIKRVSATDQK